MAKISGAAESRDESLGNSYIPPFTSSSSKPTIHPANMQRQISYSKQVLKLKENQIRVLLGNTCKSWFGLDRFLYSSLH